MKEKISQRERRGLPVTGRAPHYFFGVKTCTEEEPGSKLSTDHCNFLSFWEKMILS